MYFEGKKHKWVKGLSSIYILYMYFGDFDAQKHKYHLCLYTMFVLNDKLTTITGKQKQVHYKNMTALHS